MTTFLLVLWLITSAALAVIYFLKQRAEAAAAAAREGADAARQESEREIALAREQSQAAVDYAQQTLEQRLAEIAAESERVREHYEREIALARGESQAAVAYAQQTLEQRLVELTAESERVREHYEKEALKVHEAATQRLEAALAELAPLRGYATLQDAESEVRKTLAEAIAEAAALRREAQMLVDQTREATSEQRTASQQRAKDVRAQAEALLVQATRDAGRIAEAAERRAEQIGGDAYVALRDKQVLEQAVEALWNVVDGYGDKYVVPTRSLLDELASDFGHTEAGEELRAAREQSRRLVELKQAAACNYEEADRRDRANRFVVDAFNGRVDAILSRTKHE